MESKYWTMCNACIAKANKEKWEKKPLIEYAGEALYYDERYFEEIDELLEYLYDESIESSGDLEAEVCNTQILGEISSAAYFADQIEEDLLGNIEDGDPEYMLKDRKELVEAIESWLKKQTMQIYTPNGKRVRIPKQEEEET